MAVVGDRVFTQEQRGEFEAVVCLEAATGEEVWVDQEKERFAENLGGIGPRATPTVADGKVFALGATGRLDCIQAATGMRKWSRDIKLDSKAAVPMWGFSGSPLVVQEAVIVFAGGETERSLLAYHTETGELLWSAPAGQQSYASPQLATIGGTDQVLFLGNTGLTAVAPDSGAVIWKQPQPNANVQPSIQPHLVGATQLLVSASPDTGTLLLDVANDGTGWHTEQRWTSRDLKPFFNDFVVHDDSIYGFDGKIFCCVDLRTGKRRWKQGRYGNGQVLLLADQALLLVISESGEAVLLAANPARHEELGRFQAVNGKTWDHPALAAGRLYVRNAEEMAAYALELQNP